MKKVKARREDGGQVRYIRAINSNTIVFCHGPAGSGKTHIAAGMAATSLNKANSGVKRIIVCRPVVDCGQSIGFLPGTIEDKLGPYMAPMFDELTYYYEPEDIFGMMQKKIIEMVPLSMMRGRTFNDCYVICDEAQNATEDELKMLLTRLGQNSKMLLIGDAAQSDMPGHHFSRVSRLMGGIEDIAVVHMDKTDIVRHKLVGKILTAFEEDAITPPVAVNDYSDYEEDEDYDA